MESSRKIRIGQLDTSTGLLTGSGITNRFAKFTNTSTLTGSTSLTELPNGFIGIGTATPSALLQVSGTVLSNSFVKSGGTSSQFLMADGSVSLGSSGSVGGTGTTNYIPKWSSTTAQTNSQIFDSGTNVSIGTTDTSFAKLAINSTTAIGLAIGDLTTPTNEAGIYLRTNTKANINWATGGRLAFNSAAGGTERMTILDNGNVGIGNSNPQSKLDINGSTRTTSLKAIGRIYSINEINFDDLVSTSGSTTMWYDTALQEGFIGARNYSIASDRPMTVGGSKIMLMTGNVLIGATNDNGVDKLQVNGSLIANVIKKSGGTSSQFLMADGSVSTGSTGGGISGSGTASQVTFWNGTTSITGDTNFIWDNSLKKLLIGTTTETLGKVNIVAEGSDIFNLKQYSNTPTLGTNFTTRRYGGTLASPTGVLNTWTLFNLVGAGFTSGGEGGNTVAMKFFATGDFSPTSQPTAIDFSTTASGSTSRSQRVIINSEGYVGIGISNPIGRLEVLSTGVATFKVTNSANLDERINIGWTSGVGYVDTYNNATTGRPPFALQAFGGAVLMGTTADNTVDKLQVNGSGRFSQGVKGITSTDRPFVFGSAGAGSNYGVFLQNNNSALAYIGDANGSAISGGLVNDFAIATPNGRLFLQSSSNILLNAFGSGNILIGTSTDNGQKLQVAGDGYFKTSSVYPNILESNSGTGSWLRYIKTNTSAHIWDLGATGPTAGAGDNKFALYDSTAGVYRWVVDNNGNFGIGTTTPVNGGGAAKWLTLEGTTTYGGGMATSINGVTQGFFYSWNNYVTMAGTAGKGIKLTVNDVTDAITIPTNGNILIGTTTDNGLDKLQVYGTLGVSSGLRYSQGIDITSQDLNNITTAGFYIGSGMVNAPDGGWFYVTVERYSASSWAHQTATSFGSGNVGNRIYTRVKISDVWQGWQELAKNGDSILKLPFKEMASYQINIPSGASRWVKLFETASDNYTSFRIDGNMTSNNSVQAFTIDIRGGYYDMASAPSANLKPFVEVSTESYNERLSQVMVYKETSTRMGIYLYINAGDQNVNLIWNADIDGNTDNIIHNSLTDPASSAGSFIIPTQIVKVNNRGFVNSSIGNIGINVSNPIARFEIAGALGGSVGNGGSAIKMINTDTGNYASIGAGIVGVTNSGMQFSIDGSSKMNISSNGNLLINSTTDNGIAKLQVNGNITSSYGSNAIIGNYTWIGGSGGDYGSVGYNIGYTPNGGTYNYAVNDTSSIVRFDTGGFRFMGAPSGSAGTPIPYSDLVAFRANGNVLIGTTSDDGSKLRVNGNTRIDGAFTLVGNQYIYGTVSEVIRVIHDGAFISGFNSANTARTGYLQFNSGNNVTLASESGGKVILLNPNGGNVLIGKSADSGERLQVVGGIKFEGGGSLIGSHTFYTNDTSGTYNSRAIELREVGLTTGANSGNPAYAPAIGFHWGGVNQTKLLMANDGSLRIDGSGGGSSWGNIILHAGNYLNYQPIKLASSNTYPSNMIDDNTSAASLTEPNSLTSVAMHNSTANGLNPGGYGTTLTFSGYDRYGATQIQSKYNADTSNGILGYRNFNQFLNNWTPWRTLLDSYNLGNYTLPNYGNNGPIIDVNTLTTTALYRGSTGSWTNQPPHLDNSNALLHMDTHPGGYYTQLWFDTGNNKLLMRSASAGTWRNWCQITKENEAGNVIIGPTSDNGNKLRVFGSGYFDGNIRSFGGSIYVNGVDGVNSTTGAIYLNNGIDPKVWGLVTGVPAAFQDGFAIRNHTDNTTPLYIKNSGNVLIGTISDNLVNGNKLQVNGGITCARINQGTYINDIITNTFKSAGNVGSYHTYIVNTNTSDGVYGLGLEIANTSNSGHIFGAASGGVNRFVVKNNGNVLIGTDTDNLTNKLQVNGSILASGGFFNSDLRLKDIISRDGDIVTFKWKDLRDDKQHVGLIAQEVKEYLPDAVQEDNEGMLSVNYIEVLLTKIAQLEKRITELENK